MSPISRLQRSSSDRAVNPGAIEAGVATSSRSRSRRRAGTETASPQAARFRIATAVLVGLAIGAMVVAAAIAVGGRSTRPSALKWSSWHPLDGGDLAAQDIAEFVAPPYRATPAEQLAVVTVVNLESAAAAAAQAQANGTTSTGSGSQLQVAIRPSANSSQVSLLNGSTIAYDLCGIGGKGCAIGVGTPSINRTLLLRREALELALYTFEYVKGTN
jgi:hypothetical protein